MERKEIEKVLEDIHYIKEVISKDSIYLKRFLESKGMRYLTLFFGIVLATISFVAYLSLNNQNFNPLLFKWTLATGIILLVIITGFLKWKIWDFLFPEKPWPNMLLKIIGFPVLKIVILLLSLVFAFTIGLSINRLYQYILPAWAIGCGILFCLYGSLFNTSLALEITGYFIISGGCLSLVFIYNKPLEAWLWSGIIFGLGFLIYFIISTISYLKSREGKK